MQLKKSYIQEVFEKAEELLGKEVTLAGWVYHKREHGNLIFIDLRDGTGVIQISIHKDKVNDKVFEKAEEATRESSIIVKGVVKKDPRAPGGYEISLKDLEIVGLAEEWPIPLNASTSLLFDMRHLHLRSEKQKAILLVRESVFEAAKEYFKKNGWVEVHPPIFITAACEGGATLFEVKYFDRKAYLTQSSQLYLEALIYVLEKVYCIAPSFRAEKSRTRRHLTEFWHIEAEAAWMELEEIMRVEEGLVSHICQKVAKERSKELEFLGRDPKDIKKVKPPFERISYDEAIKRLQKKGLDVKWGDDFGAVEERKLAEDFDKPFFIYKYPKQVKAFYHMPDPERPEVVLCNDMIAPEGYGEIIGGGQRIHDKELLLKRIVEDGYDPKDYGWYIDLRRYGTVPHSGFGLGADRVVSWVCKLGHIREAVPFPRTYSRLYP